MNDQPRRPSTSETAMALLKDYRARRRQFRIFNNYDEVMLKMRSSATASIAKLSEPLKSIAARLFSIADQGFFLLHVSELKIDYLAEALIHAIKAKNPLSLANGTRALIEHISALVALLKELELLENSLRGQSSEKVITQALSRAENLIQRSYYGISSKLAKGSQPEAIHINDCLEALKKDVSDIEQVYDFLCEYVHPNYGSNVLVSTGKIASGRLNPPEEYHQEILDRLRHYCSFCMKYLSDRGIAHGAVFVRLQNLFDLCCAPGATIGNVFSLRSPNPAGDGKSQETAFHFPKARTKSEAIDFCYAYLDREGYKIIGRRQGGLIDDMICDVYTTDKGEIWFKVPRMRS